jgi:hypothetical protein
VRSGMFGALEKRTIDVVNKMMEESVPKYPKDE